MPRRACSSRRRAAASSGTPRRRPARARGPALPYARAMLAARTVHEWAHLVVAAGWVPLVVAEDGLRARVEQFVAEVDGAVAAASPSVRTLTATDAAELTASDGSVGRALARIVLDRM